MNDFLAFHGWMIQFPRPAVHICVRRQSIKLSSVGFWDSFKRWKLAQQGLSSGKKRRVRDVEAGFLVWLKTSPLVYWLICIFFITAYFSLIASSGHGSFFEEKPVASSVGAIILAATGILMMRANRAEKMQLNGVVLLLLGGIIFHLFVLRYVSHYVDKNHLPSQYKILLVPFALAPMVHSILLGRRAGNFSAVFVSIAGSLIVPREDTLVYMIVSLVCGIAAVYFTHRVRNRTQLLRAGIITGAISLVLAMLFGEILPWNITQFTMQETKETLLQIALGFLVGFVTAMVVSGLLPLLESAFTLTTNIRWLELCDLNHPLLKRMQLEAPGTFHHSLLVAALADAAAEKIGANAALCRACAYFHDIGKLNKPDYFIENQGEGCENPHNTLTPTMSALVIIAHVKDGIDLAVKNKLNPRIIEVITEHHGDSLVSYFYRKAREQKLLEENKVSAGLGNQEDLPHIDEKNFRYPGSTPRTKESGIVSLADAIESASRTLKKPTPTKVKALVDEIVTTRWIEGQLDDCKLSLCELTLVRESFSNTLRSMMHNRISYKSEDSTVSDSSKNK